MGKTTLPFTPDDGTQDQGVTPGGKEQTMSELFPHNEYDGDIINQPEIEYRVAKYPFRMRHLYIDASTKEEKTWDSTHCPVCFWNYKVYDLWDSMIDLGTKFCRRCGQKIKWEEQEGESDERI